MVQDNLLQRSLTNLFLLLLLLLPWTVEWHPGSWALDVPAEPLLFLEGIGLALLFWRQKEKTLGLLRSNLLLWPVLLMVGWSAVAAANTALPWVSWKYWIVGTGHLFVFLGAVLLMPDLRRAGLQYFLLSMAGMVAYTLINYAILGFQVNKVMLAPIPFYPDANLFAAIACMALPLVWLPELWLFAGKHRLRLRWGLSIALVGGIVLSTSRGAFLGLAAMGMFALIWRTRAWWGLWATGAVGGMLLLLLPPVQARIVQRVSGDVSTLERLNRYDCAWQMMSIRPLTGFGPGTFQFAYLPFQRPERMTRISVTSPLLERGPDTYGRGGGAHSEYFQAGAETGWPGWILLMLLISLSLAKGINAANSFAGRPMYWTACLLSFAVMALFNNFLHDARVAFLFWSAIAFLMTLGQGIKPTQ
ncbi:MAG: O-antigen ligase family protein [Lewinellaceae bacterium]|nr:O-antigen ligase family protein [Lewinellaceae bacterium]